MANKARQEIDIELGGKTYTLRPTHTALAEIEERLDGLQTPMRHIASGNLRIKDTTTVIQCCLGHLKDRPDYIDVQEMIVEAGLNTFIAAMTDILMVPFTAGTAGEAGGEPEENETPLPESPA